MGSIFNIFCIFEGHFSLKNAYRYLKLCSYTICFVSLNSYAKDKQVAPTPKKAKTKKNKEKEGQKRQDIDDVDGDERKEKKRNTTRKFI